MIQDLLTKNIVWTGVLVAGLFWLLPKLLFFIQLRFVVPYRKAAQLAHKRIEGKTTLQIENLVRKMQRAPPSSRSGALSTTLTMRAAIIRPMSWCRTMTARSSPATSRSCLPLDVNKGDPIRIVGKLGVIWNEYRSNLDTSFVESRAV